MVSRDIVSRLDGKDVGFIALRRRTGPAFEGHAGGVRPPGYAQRALGLACWPAGSLQAPAEASNDREASMTRKNGVSNVSTRPGDHMARARNEITRIGGITRRQLIRGGAVLGASTILISSTGLALPATTCEGPDQVQGTQCGWRYCHLCRGLFYNGTGNIFGVCPARAQGHDPRLSDYYQLQHGFRIQNTQCNWRHCKKCQGLAFETDPPSYCPAGNRHNHSGSYNYDLHQTNNVGGLQRDWRHCKLCQGLHYHPDGLSFGRCPSAGRGVPSQNFHTIEGSSEYFLIKEFEPFDCAPP
jgi:hypothetical protein